MQLLIRDLALVNLLCPRTVSNECKIVFRKRSLKIIQS